MPARTWLRRSSAMRWEAAPFSRQRRSIPAHSVARFDRRRLECRVQPERGLDGAAHHPASAGDETTRMGPSHLAGQRRGHDVLSHGAGYAATKSANANLAVSLAKELAGTGITSNAVSPAMIVTPGVEEMLLGESPGFRPPARRPGRVEDRTEEHGAQPQRTAGHPETLRPRSRSWPARGRLY